MDGKEFNIDVVIEVFIMTLILDFIDQIALVFQ